MEHGAWQACTHAHITHSCPNTLADRQALAPVAHAGGSTTRTTRQDLQTRTVQTEPSGSPVPQKTGRFNRFLPVRLHGRSFKWTGPLYSLVRSFTGRTAGPVLITMTGARPVTRDRRVRSLWEARPVMGFDRWRSDRWRIGRGWARPVSFDRCVWSSRKSPSEGV
jgi:hypothetical protein